MSKIKQNTIALGMEEAPEVTEGVDGKCAHGRFRGQYCPECIRDAKQGRKFAAHKYANDKGFQKAVDEYAKELFVIQRQKLARAAHSAAMKMKHDLGLKLSKGEGIWWPELSPLTPPERGIVLKQVKHDLGFPEPEDKH